MAQQNFFSSWHQTGFCFAGMWDEREFDFGQFVAVLVLHVVTCESRGGTVGIVVSIAMWVVRMMAWYVRHNVPQREFGMVKSACLPDGLAFRRGDAYLPLDFAWCTSKVWVREKLTCNWINFLIVSLGTLSNFIVKTWHPCKNSLLRCKKLDHATLKNLLFLEEKINRSEKSSI